MWQSWQSSSRDSKELTRFQWINQLNSRLDRPNRQQSPLLCISPWNVNFSSTSQPEWIDIQGPVSQKGPLTPIKLMINGRILCRSTVMNYHSEEPKKWMKLRQIRKTETCGKERNLYLRRRKLWGPAHSTWHVCSKKIYSKLKSGSQNGCWSRIIQICNDRFYTSEEHTHNSFRTAGLGSVLRASKITICATTLGPVYTEKSCTG